MKNQELFHKTIGILVNAYMNDTLEYADCRACAVGNLIAEAEGTKVIRRFNNDFEWANTDKHIMWTRVINTSTGTLFQHSSHLADVVESMLKTGYSLQELADIEYGFYVGFCGSKEKNFTGLMSVCDTLMQIHEATTEEITEAKSLFIKELAV